VWTATSIRHRKGCVLRLERAPPQLRQRSAVAQPEGNEWQQCSLRQNRSCCPSRTVRGGLHCEGEVALTPVAGPAAHRGRDQTTPALVPKGRTDPSMSPHAACLMQASRGAQPDDRTAADGVIKRAGFAGRSLQTSTLGFFTALVGRGLVGSLKFPRPLGKDGSGLARAFLTRAAGVRAANACSSAASIDYPASATHSISQPLPNRSCIDHAIRGGGLIGKNSR
jgi:hypothetical protein